VPDEAVDEAAPLLKKWETNETLAAGTDMVVRDEPFLDVDFLDQKKKPGKLYHFQT
jgi:hypothetical protein